MFESADRAAWTVAEGHTGEYPFFTRYRHFGPSFSRNDYPTRLNVFWSMRSPDKHGLPTTQEAADLGTFEDRLLEAVEKDESAWLVAVVTGRAERELVFYLQQPALFLQGLTDMPQEQERYPLEIHSQGDPDWSYYDDLAPVEQ